MRKTGKNQVLKGLLLTFAFAFGVFVWSSDSIVSLAATAKVVADNGMIRAKADKNSDVVGSVKSGDTLEIISSSSDGSYTWYKVYVNSEKTGYIRGDLVTVDGQVTSEEESQTSQTTSVTVVGSNKNTQTHTVGSSSSQTTTVGSNSSETATTVESSAAVGTTDVATAKATADVRVRKGPGTNFDVAGQAKQGTEVSVSGVAADSDGKNWYQVSFQDGSKSVNGYIREDFLEVLSRVEVPVEEPTVEEPVVEETPVVDNQDYQLHYMLNDAGEMDWYLFDNVNGTSQSLTQILRAVEQIQEQELQETEQVSTMRIIIYGLAAVVVILFIVVTILGLKLRDAYEYEYEDDEDDEDDEDEEDDDEEDDDDDEDDDEDADEEKSSKKSRFGFLKKKEVVEDDDEDDDEDEEDKEETLEEIQPVKPVKNKKPENKAWQSKDFLELDDDMEFEFLDL